MERIMRHFDEAAYLAANPDVAVAVHNGNLPSGRMHFEIYGLAEGRSLGMPSRRDRMLYGLDPSSQQGVELGPLTTPIVHKHEGRILYVDHADTETIRAKYARHPHVDCARIVPIDVAWVSGRLQDAFEPGFQADYVLASPVIEHVPDLVTWLADIHDILAPSGLLRLAVPDRRYTFDFLRRETELHEVLDAYVQRATVPTPHVVLDHCLNFRTVDLHQAWRGTLDPANLPPTFSVAEAITNAREVTAQGAYLDVHCWVFTPTSFARLMEQATAAGLARFACVDVQFPRPFDNDFVTGLEPSDNVPAMVASWRQMRERAEQLDSP
jgi:methyltransferase family protein